MCREVVGRRFIGTLRHGTKGCERTGNTKAHRTFFVFFVILVLVVPVEPAFAHDAPTLLPTKLEFDATQAPKTCNDSVEFRWLLVRWVPPTVWTDDAARRLSVHIQRTKGGGKQVDVALVDSDGMMLADDHKAYSAQAECHKVLSETAQVSARLLGALEPPPPRQPLACPVCPPPQPQSDPAKPLQRAPHIPSATVRPLARLPNPLLAGASHERASVFAGPAVLVSPGGLSPSVQLVMGGHLPLHSRLSAEVLTFLPLTSGRVENANGAMTVRQLFFGQCK